MLVKSHQHGAGDGKMKKANATDAAAFSGLERWGLPFTFAAAVLLLYCYPLSGGAVWTILAGAVNGSVWEYLKTLALPYLFWSAIELCAVRMPLRRMVVAKTAGLYFMLGGVAGCALLYRSMVGARVAWADMLLAFVWIAGAQALSWRLALSPRAVERFFPAAAAALACFLGMYLFFTARPPRCALFWDPDAFSYGLPVRQQDLEVLCPDVRGL